MKKIIFLFVMATMSVTIAWAQKKEILASGYRTVKVYIEKPAKIDGKILESSTTYDSNGNVLEEIEYNDEGKLKKHKKYTYDSNGNELTEIELDEKGNTIGKTETKYQNGVRVERTEYDAKGKLKNRRTYQYAK